MSKHTPGPWVVNEAGFVVHATSHRYIEIADCGAQGHADTDANARLIAAAPELLDACEAALHNSLDLPSGVVEMLERAIAKAEGAA